MDKDTLTLIEETAQKAADRAVTTAVAKMRELHLEDLKVLGERMDAGFESVDRRFVELEVRMDRIESALATILAEFKEDREKVRNLERQVIELTTRVKFLEEKLATSHSQL